MSTTHTAASGVPAVPGGVSAAPTDGADAPPATTPDAAPTPAPAPSPAAATTPGAAPTPAAAQDDGFDARLAEHLPRLRELFAQIWGDDPRATATLDGLVGDLRASWAARPPDLKASDAARVADPDWFQSQQMLGGVCYVDRYAGTLAGLRERLPYLEELGLTYLHLMPLFAAPEPESDGGYAISSYRDVRQDLGTVEELASLAAELRARGISLVLDFVFNHTSDEHVWARRALAGEKEFEDYYWMFPDRQMPDAFEATTREIFPDDHPGSFVQLEDGRWVWATFHGYQWDLNYRNPAVFRAMAGELLFLANLGVDVLRMDAVAFIWKELGTACESLPQAHLLLQAFNVVCRIAAPGVLFKSEAIVHPDEVVTYIDPAECQLSYDPLQMALIWSTLATRDAGLLTLALDERHTLPPGTAWVSYVRSHDDIGWTFADEDAARLGIDGYVHRRFLNDFYNGRVPGSFARGVPFQENPRTGDARVSGATASLAGLEAGDPGGVDRIVLAHSVVLATGGIPLLYLGDEVGQTNDWSFRDDPGLADDSRWVGRPWYPADRYAERDDPTTPAGAIFARLRRLIEVRRTSPELAGNRLVPFHTNDSRVLGFQRPGTGPDGAPSTVLVLANFGDDPALVTPVTLSGLPERGVDLVTGLPVELRAGVTLPAHGFVWIRVKWPRVAGLVGSPH